MNDLTHNFVIETDVPIPTNGSGGRPRSSAISAGVCAVLAGPVGGSAFFPLDLFDGKKSRPANLVTRAANNAGGPGWYTARCVDGGVRLWKLSDPQTVAA